MLFGKQRPSAIVALVTHVKGADYSKAGSAELMLSPQEARLVAEMLIVSANRAEQITRDARESQAVR